MPAPRIPAPRLPGFNSPGQAGGPRMPVTVMPQGKGGFAPNQGSPCGGVAPNLGSALAAVAGAAARGGAFFRPPPAQRPQQPWHGMGKQGHQAMQQHALATITPALQNLLQQQGPPGPHVLPPRQQPGGFGG